jgi:hypothetical protein
MMSELSTEEKLDLVLQAMGKVQKAQQDSENRSVVAEARLAETLAAVNDLEEQVRMIAVEKREDEHKVSVMDDDKIDGGDSIISSPSEDVERPVGERSIARSSYKPSRPPLFAGDPADPNRARAWRVAKLQMDG